MAIQRAGRVFGIVRTMSLAPRVLKASMGLYRAIMFAEAGLSRRQREMIAVVVSRANDCHYCTQAHTADLRVEVQSLPDQEREPLLESIATIWREAQLDEADRGLCSYAEKLTRTPTEVTQEDVVVLRELGFNDVAIHDLIQVVSYFNYINRVADAVHVDLEPEMEAYKP